MTNADPTPFDDQQWPDDEQVMCGGMPAVGASQAMLGVTRYVV
jgi:hypothetical protein